MSAIANSLSGKTLLVTGSTGFLAKGVIEKIFRHTPDIARMYLLVRTKRLRDGSMLSPDKRIEQEIFPSAAFAKLRDMYGDRFLETFRHKVIGVAGDLTLDHLGIDPDVYQQMAQEVQLVITCAASVSFDDEVDSALQLNALGAKRVMEFAQACSDATLIHVSTAYVSGQRRGRIPESTPVPDRSMAQEIGRSQKPFNLDQEIKEIITVSKQIHEASQSPEQEKAFRKAALRQNPKASQRWLDSQQETFRKRWIKQQLIDDGSRRAKSWGWNDIYTMTKSMGEQLIVKNRGDLPVAIVRPSIIEGSLVEPEPGWVEDLKVADTLINAISKGRSPDFPAKRDIILDIVPVDIVVNTVLAAIPRTIYERGISVYHAATGDKNPIKLTDLFDLVYDYFNRNPRLDKKGQPIPVERWTFPNVTDFERQHRIKYVIPFNTAQWCLDRLSWISATYRWRQRMTVLTSALAHMMHTVKLYSPYTTLDCQFETSNTQRLHDALDASDQSVFNCDVTRIRWKEYIQDIHIPGLKRHIFKEGIDQDEDVDMTALTSPEFAAPDEDALPHLDTITDILEKSAETYGTKTALQIKQNDTWICYTYQEVHDLAGYMGWHWRQQGLHPDDRVLLYAENKPEWGIAYFAAMAAGAAVVPIDRQTTADEIWSIARFTEARAILCSELCFKNLSEKDKTQEIFLWNIDNYGLTFDEPRRVQPPIEEGEGPPAWAPVEPETVASIIFTKGTAIDPRGVILTHRNFVSDLLALADVLRAYRTDHFLSILPLNHALEFTGGFLMPFYAGATITYTDTLKSRVLVDLMEETKTTCILAVPRIFKLLYDRLRKKSEETISNDGTQPEDSLVGRMRLLVSGGAALDTDLYNSYQQLALTIYEGYGLTETAPILTVNPMGKSKPASVGLPLKGIDLYIDNPDNQGHGEIVVRGANMMSGYYKNPTATAEYLRDGWLYTGDIGRVDEEGYVYITGRSKDLIVTGAGKNVYPDEVEWFYKSVPYTKEFLVVGMQSSQSLSEDVHAVVIPDWETYPGPPDPETLRSEIMTTVQSISKSLPSYQRIQHVHVLDEPAMANGSPQTRRAQFRQILEQQNGQTHRTSAEMVEEKKTEITWEQIVYDVIGQLTNRPVAEIICRPEQPLDEMMDSLMRIELLAALETRFNTSIPDEEALQIQTVQDVLNTTQKHKNGISSKTVEDIQQPVDTSDYWSKVLQGQSAESHQHIKERRTRTQDFARWCFWVLGRMLYRGYFQLSHKGLDHLPKNMPYIIAANHSSHLDSGAVIATLWRKVDYLNILGAKDYFFDTSFKSWFFTTVMHALPFDRHDKFVEGLQVSSKAISPNTPILIYPEGTRSIDGNLQPFKVGLGLLALELNVPIVPAYIRGTHEAMPKGRSFPKRHRIEVVLGPPIIMEPYRVQKGSRMNYDLYREVVNRVYQAIEDLRDNRVN